MEWNLVNVNQMKVSTFRTHSESLGLSDYRYMYSLPDMHRSGHN